MIKFKSLLLGFLVCIPIVYNGCGSASETQNGVRGVVATADNKPAKGAVVMLLHIKNENDTATILDTTITNADGQYTFENIGSSQYLVTSNFTTNSLELKGAIPQFDHTENTFQELPVCIVKEPGVIKGKILIDNNTFVLSMIRKTREFEILGNNDSLLFSLPEGNHQLRLIPLNTSKYLPIDTTIILRTKDTVQLGNIKFRNSPEGEPPLIDTITYSYDTSSGIINLTWPKLEVSDISKYMIVKSGIYKDTFYTTNNLLSDTLHLPSIDTTYQIFYSIRAIDSSEHQGPFKVISITVKNKVAHGYWLPEQEMPFSGSTVVAGIYDSCIYMIGADTIRKVGIFAYNPFKKTWRQKVPLQVSRLWTSASIIDSTIFIIGGVPYPETTFNTDGKVVESYNVKNGKIGFSKPLNSAIVFHVSLQINKELFVLGGSPVIKGLKPMGNILKYSLSTNSWQTLPSYWENAKTTMISLSNGTSGYLFGGESEGSISRVSNAVFYFNNNLPIPQLLRPLKEPRKAGCAVLVDSTCYLIGGNNNKDSLSSSIELYPLSQGASVTSTTIPIPRKCNDCGAAYIDNKIYIFGGIDSLGDRINKMRIYVP